MQLADDPLEPELAPVPEEPEPEVDDALLELLLPLDAPAVDPDPDPLDEDALPLLELLVPELLLDALPEQPASKTTTVSKRRFMAPRCYTEPRQRGYWVTVISGTFA